MKQAGSIRAGLTGLRDLVAENLDFSVCGVRLRQLSVHRHLPATSEIEMHTHSFAQLIVYLKGRGEQVIDGASHAISEGALVQVAAGTPHAFRRTTPRSPVCLVIDFEDASQQTDIRRIPEVTLRELKTFLVRLSAIKPDASDSLESDLPARLELHGWATIMLARLLSEKMGARKRSPVPVVRKRVERVLARDEGFTLSARAIAHACGYQQDYLNRRLKQETGLTLNQFRSQQRLLIAKRRLEQGAASREAAEAAGFLDVNYFTRWFRQQTGLAPKRWVQSEN